MICKKCSDQGLKSKMCQQQQTYQRLMAQRSFYDEEGRLHIHDGNRETTKYICTNGHEWTLISFHKCVRGRDCDWKGGEDSLFESNEEKRKQWNHSQTYANLRKSRDQLENSYKDEKVTV